MARRKFKKNQVMASILGYYYYIRGVEKSGKTTLFYEINQELYGCQDKGLLISMGKEDGYKALPDIQYEVIDNIKDSKGKTVKSGWKQFVELVDDLVEDKKNGECDIELIAIDTYDEFTKLVGDEVVRLSNIKNPTKKCESINAAFGGFNGGFEKYEELVEEQLHKLRRAGFTLFVISHTKVRTIKEKGMNEDESYQMLTTNLDSRFDNVISHKADVIATIQIDKDIIDGKLNGTNRYIYFRESNFVKAGSRFNNIVEKVELSAKNFITAIEDGIKNSMRKPITDEEFEKKKVEDEKIRQEKIDKEQEKIESLKIPVDLERNEEIKEIILSKWKETSAEIKTQIKNIMEKYSIEKITNVDGNLTEGMEEILKIIE